MSSVLGITGRFPFVHSTCHVSCCAELDIRQWYGCRVAAGNENWEMTGILVAEPGNLGHLGKAVRMKSEKCIVPLRQFQQRCIWACWLQEFTKKKAVIIWEFLLRKIGDLIPGSQPVAGALFCRVWRRQVSYPAKLSMYRWYTRRSILPTTTWRGNMNASVFNVFQRLRCHILTIIRPSNATRFLTLGAYRWIFVSPEFFYSVFVLLFCCLYGLRLLSVHVFIRILKAKAQVLDIVPFNWTQQCQRHFTTVEVVSDWHWL